MEQKTKIDIQKIIENMTIEQKVGQCLVLGFVGTVMTPKILERIRKYTPAGIRCSVAVRMKDANQDPYAYNKDRLDRVIRKPVGAVKDFTKGLPVPFATNEEYCAFLNTMKKEALENGAGVPLHITLDMEGDASADYNMGGINYFPSAMGIGKSADLKLAYEVGWAIARQVSALGFSWIHSPVLDVNTNPNNPEIGTRSFSEDPEKAFKYAMESFKGLKDGGLIATGKHFPGRGASDKDAHGSLPVIDISKEEMSKHLLTFKGLVDAGIPSIMTAHTVYPALDPSGMPATLSKKILTDLLKGEMGFKGAITTDDITMGGIVEKFEVHEACILALNAGADLILFRDESSLIDDVFPKLVDAARRGIISEKRLNDAIRRTLTVKYEYGLFENGAMKDIAQAGSGINDPKVKEIAIKAAEKTVSILRDRDNLLPLSNKSNILLIEQVHSLHKNTNTVRCHPSLLWEKMLKYCENVGIVETSLQFDEDDKKRVLSRVSDADIIVATNYNHRRNSNGNEFIKELHSFGKPVIVVTNSPYKFTVQPEYGTIIINYGASPESFELVSASIFGKR